jgi:hypothetical protein
MARETADTEVPAPIVTCTGTVTVSPTPAFTCPMVVVMFCATTKQVLVKIPSMANRNVLNSFFMALKAYLIICSLV